MFAHCMMQRKVPICRLLHESTVQYERTVSTHTKINFPTNMFSSLRLDECTFSISVTSIVVIVKKRQRLYYYMQRLPHTFFLFDLYTFVFFITELCKQTSTAKPSKCLYKFAKIQKSLLS